MHNFSQKDQKLIDIGFLVLRSFVVEGGEFTPELFFRTIKKRPVILFWESKFMSYSVAFQFLSKFLASKCFQAYVPKFSLCLQCHLQILFEYTQNFLKQRLRRYRNLIILPVMGKSFNSNPPKEFREPRGEFLIVTFTPGFHIGRGFRPPPFTT